MMKRLPLVFALFAVVLSLQCAKKADSNVTVAVTPTTAIIIPYGSGTKVGGKDMTAPYFEITSVTITWKGTGTFKILALQVTSSKSEIKCAYGGDDLATIFLDTGTTIAQTDPVSSVTSTYSFGCSGLSVDPEARPYNIPATLEILGAVYDAAGNTTGRADGRVGIKLN